MGFINICCVNKFPFLQLKQLKKTLFKIIILVQISVIHVLTNHKGTEEQIIKQ